MTQEPTPQRVLAGRFRVLERLGTGAMATVFLAQDERLDRRVAVKRLHADSPEDVARRFEREARLGASLNHPNLVAVYDTVTDEEGVLIVMEYVEGRTLAEALRDGRLPPPQALGILDELADALDHAHDAGIVHRDVKPANVLIDPADGVKLADLGIATATAGAQITRSGTALGTPSYMAPEQFEGNPPTTAVDVYALAAIAFEMLSGRKANTADTPVAIAHRAATGPPADLREAWPGAPSGAAEALKRGLAPDPGDRPSSARELVDQLDTAFAGQREEPGHGLERARSSRWRALPVAALAIAMAALGAIALVTLVGGERKEGGRGEPAAEPAQDRGGSSRAGAPGGRPGAVPAATVEAFYTRSAADDFQGAWELTSPRFRDQLGGFEAFRGSVDSLESIEFTRTTPVEEEGGNRAVVAISTIARHETYAERCTGRIELVRDGSWRLDRARDLSCRRS